MRALLLPMLLLVAGCNLNLPTWQGTWREAQAGIPGLAEAQLALSGGGFDGALEPPEDEAVLRLQLGGRRAHARLLQETGSRRLWRTPGGVVVQTEGGRVVATAGLAQALVATRFETTDPLPAAATLPPRGASSRRQVDLATATREPGGLRFGLLLRCRLLPAGEQAGVLLVEEHCEGEQLGGFTNRFWLEAASGTLLRSEQWIGPNLPPLLMQEVGPG